VLRHPLVLWYAAGIALPDNLNPFDLPNLPGDLIHEFCPPNVIKPQKPQKSQKPQKPHGLYGIISQNSLNSNALVVYRLPLK
jgi:hypothetical protein